MTSILGISAFYHDSAATIIIDGKIIAAAQEERFTRKKHDPDFPSNAIKYCMSEAGINSSDLYHLKLVSNPFQWRPTYMYKLLEICIERGDVCSEMFCVSLSRICLDGPGKLVF